MSEFNDGEVSVNANSFTRLSARTTTSSLYQYAPRKRSNFYKGSWFSAIICFYLKTFDFVGRSTRKEYYAAMIMGFLVEPTFWFVMATLSTPIAKAYGHNDLLVLFFGIMWILVAIRFYLFLPLQICAVAARRFHDLNMSGLFALLCLIPLVPMVLLFYFSKRGSVGDNNFGVDPRDAIHAKAKELSDEE